MATLVNTSEFDQTFAAGVTVYKEPSLSVSADGTHERSSEAHFTLNNSKQSQSAAPSLGPMAFGDDHVLEQDVTKHLKVKGPENTQKPEPLPRSKTREQLDQETLRREQWLRQRDMRRRQQPGQFFEMWMMSDQFAAGFNSLQLLPSVQATLVRVSIIVSSITQ